MTSLSTTHRPLIAFLALLALVLGQSAAGLHALKHFGSRSDVAGAPAQHVPVCLDCASFAPVTGVHGGPAGALDVARVATGTLAAFADVAIASSRDARPFQARAPPR